jgi:hypothetical protein
MSALNQISTEIDIATGIIEGFRSAAATGQVVDLTGLDTRIEALCSDITAMPAGERRKLHSRLLSLVDDLNRLVGVIESQQRDVAAGIRDVTSRQKAVSAYSHGAESSDPSRRGTPKKKPT